MFASIYESTKDEVQCERIAVKPACGGAHKRISSRKCGKSMQVGRLREESGIVEERQSGRRQREASFNSEVPFAQKVRIRRLQSSRIGLEISFDKKRSS